MAIAFVQFTRFLLLLSVTLGSSCSFINYQRYPVQFERDKEKHYYVYTQRSGGLFSNYSLQQRELTRAELEILKGNTPNLSDPEMLKRVKVRMIRTTIPEETSELLSITNQLVNTFQVMQKNQRKGRAQVKKLLEQLQEADKVREELATQKEELQKEIIRLQSRQLEEAAKKQEELKAILDKEDTLQEAQMKISEGKVFEAGRLLEEAKIED